VIEEKPEPARKPKKLLDRFKVKVSNQEFEIEIYNQDLSSEKFKIYSVVVNGTTYGVEVESLGIDESIKPPAAEAKATKPADHQDVKPESNITPSSTTAPVQPQPTATKNEMIHSDKVLTAPMPGKILEIKIKIGDKVEAGQPLIILEAMKMENVMTAPASGTIREIPVQVGINVNQGENLVIID
jgi:biotin carboxyl carrier protein